MRNGTFQQLFIVIAIAFCLSLIDCSKEIVDPINTFNGMVRDSATLLPIDSAWIGINDSLSPYETFTDSSGMYFHGILGTSEISIFCGKNGYITKKTVLFVNKHYDSVNFILQQK